MVRCTGHDRRHHEDPDDDRSERRARPPSGPVRRAVDRLQRRHRRGAARRGRRPDRLRAAPPGAPWPAEPGRTGRRRRTEAKVVIVGSGPAGLTAAIYAARANLEPIVLAGSAAGRPADDHERRRELPGLPGRDPGPGADGRVPRAGRARSGRTSSTSTSTGSTSRSARSGSGRAASSTAPRRSSSPPARSRSGSGLESETRLRGRGVSACATCDGFFFRDKEIAVVGGGDTALEEATFLTRFATQGPPAPPARRVPRQQDHGRPGARPTRRSRSTPTPRSRRSSATPTSRALAPARHRRPATERTMPAEGLFVAIGHKPEQRGLPGLARGRREGLPRGPRPDRLRRSTACSSPATSTTIATARRSPPPATAAGRPSTPSAGSRRRASPRPQHRDRVVIGRRSTPAVRRDELPRRRLAAAGGAAARRSAVSPAASPPMPPRSGAAGRSAGSPRSSGPTGRRSRVVFVAILVTSLLGLINPLLLGRPVRPGHRRPGLQPTSTSTSG